MDNCVGHVGYTIPDQSNNNIMMVLALTHFTGDFVYYINSMVTFCYITYYHVNNIVAIMISALTIIISYHVNRYLVR